MTFPPLSPLSVSSPLCTKLTRWGGRRGKICLPSSVFVKTATKLCPIRGRSLKPRFTEMGVTLLLQHPQGLCMHTHNTHTVRLERYSVENTTQCLYGALDNNTHTQRPIFFPYSAVQLHIHLFLVLIRTFSSTELHKYSDKYHSKSPSFLCWYEKWLVAAKVQAGWYQRVYTDVDDSRWLWFWIQQSAKWLRMNTLHVKYRLG